MLASFRPEGTGRHLKELQCGDPSGYHVAQQRRGAVVTSLLLARFAFQACFFNHQAFPKHSNEYAISDLALRRSHGVRP